MRRVPRTGDAGGGGLRALSFISTSTVKNETAEGEPALRMATHVKRPVRIAPSNPDGSRTKETLGSFVFSSNNYV